MERFQKWLNEWKYLILVSLVAFGGTFLLAYELAAADVRLLLLDNLLGFRQYTFGSFLQSAGVPLSFGLLLIVPLALQRMRVGWLRNLSVNNPDRIALYLAVTAFAIVLFLTWIFYGYDSAFNGNVLVEAHGMVYDLIIIGWLVFWLNKIGEDGREIKGYREEIEDYLGWDEPEAKYRVIGNIKRLNRLKISDINLTGAFLENGKLQGLDLRRANLSEAQLSYANLRGANLSKANFQHAVLNYADLRGADLSGADFWRAELFRIRLEDAKIDDETKFESGNWKLAAKIVTLGIEGLDLAGKDLSNMYLRGVNFSKANLKESELMHSDVRDANFSYANLERAELGGADFSGAILEGARLVAAVVGPTTVFNKTNLQAADFSKANLRRCNLSGLSFNATILSQANLTGTDLSKARLEMANLNEVDITGAILNSTYLWRVQIDGVDFTTAADLKGIVFGEMGLTDKDFSGCDLSGAKFVETFLTNVDFHDAILTGATFREAHLHEVNLEGADLRKASLANTFLKEVKLTGAIYDNDTRWPPEFDPKDAKAINVDKTAPMSFV